MPDLSAFTRITASKYFLWALLALPAVPMTALLIAGDFGEVLHETGEFAARFMIIAMIATPLQMLWGHLKWPLSLPVLRAVPRWLIRNRRYFGVAAFGYAALHTLGYVGDLGSFQRILAELGTFGIWTGWAAFMIFIPLAVTSNNLSQRMLGRTWKSLQRITYAAAVFTLVHWIFIEYEPGPALVHFLPLAALEGWRILHQRRKARAAS